MANPFLMYDNVVPLLQPADITNSTTASAYMDLRNAHAIGFLVMVGNVHSGTATDTEVITVEAATSDAGADEVAVPFWYRQASAVGANVWGAVTSCSSAGLTYAVTDDNKFLWIEVDPAELAAENADYRYLRVKFTANPDMANCVVGVAGFLQARYKSSTMITATASASA